MIAAGADTPPCPDTPPWLIAAQADVMRLAAAIEAGTITRPARVATPPGLLATGGIGWIMEICRLLTATPATAGIRLLVDCGDDAARAHRLAQMGVADLILAAPPAVLDAVKAAASGGIVVIQAEMRL
ncbi:hypothetical protein GCM10011505_07780 [Tistrella bauzanensis]|uniref:Uncharacterized protein n=1 Tax=Tistrella bauzanensis TaxID=657419 RepID=A0ABQ1IBD6_9PROT|nr:hypothetical protein [Tistrella bauzanensis]GGB28926.1 hypothetical protein GCM10011505_07780 [Tistrella bauzanensis]